MDSGAFLAQTTACLPAQCAGWVEHWTPSSLLLLCSPATVLILHGSNWHMSYPVPFMPPKAAVKPLPWGSVSPSYMRRCRHKLHLSGCCAAALAWTGILFGLAGALALLHDIHVVLSLPVLAHYLGVATLYNRQQRAARTMWRMMRGKR